MKVNYQLMCDEQINQILQSNKVPKLLLHSCCGPCSSYVLKYLSEYFDISVLFFNPNIFPQEEYEKRLVTQKEVLEKMNLPRPVSLIGLPYAHDEFTAASENLEEEPEGGARCVECFRLRLEKTAFEASERCFDFFTTTLSVSPHKNADLLNRIGREMMEKYGVEYLFSDFKKREGYKKSIELSKELELYRQEYCGCEFSLR